MTNYLRIGTNKGNKVDGGFRHTVFESSTLNGKKSINMIASARFDGVLNELEHIEDYRKNPSEFLKGLSDDETPQCDTAVTCDDPAA